MARILIIAYSTYTLDGRVKRNAEALAIRGNQVDVVCLECDAPPQPCGVNVIGIRIPRYRGSSRSRYLRSYFRFFSRAALLAFRRGRQRGYALAIVCTMPDIAILAGLPLRFLGTKLVLDVHDTMPEIYRDKFGNGRGELGARLLTAVERLSARFADRVLAVHVLHKTRLIQSGIPANKITVVMNAPDRRIFTPLPNGNRATSGEDFTIAYHGSVTHRLGLDVAVRAMAELRHTVPRARLLIIGSGEYLIELKMLVRAQRLEDIVLFAPPVPLEELPAALQEVRVGLVPNRATHSTHLMLPVKLMEYVALGIPVVASRLRTIEHYFPSGTLDFFEPGNPKHLASVLERLYRDPGRGADLARAAQCVLCTIDWTAQREALYGAVGPLLRLSNDSGGIELR